MKKKFLLPTVVLCVGTSLWALPVRADETLKSDQAARMLNSSQVLHARVLDQSGQKIGDVEDLILDPTTSRVSFAVVKLSGDLADNGKYTPIPFSLLKASSPATRDTFGHRDLVFQGDRDKLLSASRFNTKDWPATGTVMWGPDVYAHYGVPWEGTLERGGTGAAIESGPPVRYYSETYNYPPRAYHPKPIDNGTGPDGKGTFHFYYRQWPYYSLEGTH